jgi:uncharacterized protein (DUF1800 family)
MPIERREFLRLAGLVAAGVGAASCSPLYNELSQLPAPVGTWSNVPLTVFNALRRMTYGPTTEELQEAVSIGVQGWIEQQLAPRDLDDIGAELRVRKFEAIREDADFLSSWKRQGVVQQLKQSSIVRKVYSRRQVFEMMVEFWTDHFNISVEKGDCWFLKVVDDREVIRQNALGNFRDLLHASAHSPAMLVYLDNQANISQAPNENYAREVMELHTLGVDGGYSQEDVMELARCLTGWTVKERFWRGEYTFNEDIHDSGHKRVLNLSISPAGEQEAEIVLDEISLHPATAFRLAYKLYVRFLGDDPDLSLVRSAADAFLSSKGEIRSLLKVILMDGMNTHDLMPKFKRPIDFVVSAMRMLSADTDGDGSVQGYLSEMGQAPFEWPTPDGPPDAFGFWSTNLMPRWRFALQLAANEVEGSSIDLYQIIAASGVDTPEDLLVEFGRLLLGEPMSPALREQLLRDFADARATDETTMAQILVAGLVASPAFQWR